MERWKKSLIFLLGSFALSCSFSLSSNPSMPTIVSGAATFEGTTNELFIGTSSDRTIIDWVDFSIQAGQITDFLQPSATSATLNRVTSANPSDIFGTLRSNGQIFLINPNGILVGNTGSVDVSALIASTLDVLNAEFLAGMDMTFSGVSTATIQNSGLIRGGNDGVFLLGRHIINERDIIAISGRADIGAGNSILLQSGNAGIIINADTGGTQQGTGIENTGGIHCNQTALRADGNLYSLAIRHTGTIFAQTITQRDGEIILIAESGETRIEENGNLLAHGNGTGGVVHVLGQTVNVLGQADINTQNIFGGGEILIGGSEDNDPLILEAVNTTVGPNALISSDAHILGNAGTVVVFATGTADFAGRITATGGIAGGDGGFVELSGLGNLIFTGIVDTRAPNGATGTLFLDPTNITISGAATAGGAFDGGSPTNTFSGGGVAATLNNGDLNTALQTNNVVVTTASGGGGVGDITIGAATVLNLLTESHTLTLLADNDIVVSSTLTMVDSSGGGTSALNLTAGNDITMTAVLTGTSLDAINISGAGDVTISNDINAIGASLSISAGGDILSLGGGDNDLSADQITFNAGGDIILTNELNSTGGGSSSNLSWTAGVDINIINDIDFNSWGTVTLTATTQDIIIDNNIIANVVDTMTLSAGRTVITQGAGTILLSDAAGNQTDLIVNAGLDVTIDNDTDVNDFNSATFNAVRDVLFNDDFEPDNTLTVSINAGNNITSITGGNIILANVDQFNMTTTNGDVNIGEGVSIAGANTIVTSGNDINILDLFISTMDGDITMTAARDINVGPATILSQIGTRLGDVNLTTGRDLNITGGATTSDRSQVGFSATLVDSDIELTIGRDINVTAGSNSSSVAIIGHGFATSGSYAGDIIINSVGRNVTLLGDTGATGATKFAQIGHSRTAGTSTFAGDIRGSVVGSPALISGALTLVGGADSTCFALFGHGGRDVNVVETYSGNVRVQANSITLTGGTSTDCFAAIGYFIVAQAGAGSPTTINSPANVQAISDTSIAMTASTNGIVSIGGRILTDNALSSIRLDLVDVQSGGNLTMTSGTGVETEATIGAFVDLGVSETAISMDIGGGLFMNAGTGAPARIINGTSTTALKDINIDVVGDITPTVAGAFGSFIQGTTGNVTVTAGGTITMPDPLTFIRNSGGSNGTLSVTGGTTLLSAGGFFSNIGTGSTSFATTIGNLSILSTSFISSIGSAAGNVANDLILLDSATITSSMGSMGVTAGRDINITGASGGSSFITSSGIGSYLAGRDITLIGTSAIEEGFIENSIGNLTLAAGIDIEVGTFGRIENLGTGNLTLVADNLFPTPPGIGPGAFDLSSLGSIGRLGGGPLRIFTAVREQNLISGTLNLNGTTFIAGPLFVDSATEQWNTYFPSTFGGSPFTIFYKNGAPIPPPTPAEILALNPNAFIPFAELFYILEGYPMDPVVAWLYDICIDDDCLCLERDYCHEKTLRYNYEIVNCRKLPPYIKKLDLLPHH